MTTADQLDLFTLTTRTCTDCGAVFETSRPAARCATCASLRAGQLGPCVVHCPACDAEHQIPILAPTRLCLACRADLGATRQRVRGAWGAAMEAWDALHVRHIADVAHADDTTRERFNRLLAMRGAATFEERLSKAALLPDWALVLDLWAQCHAVDAAAALVDRLRSALVEVDDATL